MKFWSMDEDPNLSPWESKGDPRPRPEHLHPKPPLPDPVPPINCRCTTVPVYISHPMDGKDFPPLEGLILDLAAEWKAKASIRGYLSDVGPREKKKR